MQLEETEEILENHKTQIINISGTKFEVSETTWTKIKNTIPKLSHTDLHYQGSEVFVERHPTAFQAILYHYQSGDLHMPTDLCPASFEREMDFWGIAETCMAKCCFAKYVAYFDDQEALKILEKDESITKSERGVLIRMTSFGGWRALQAKVWLIFNEPFYSIASKIYFGISLIFILISVFALVAGTHPDFQRPLTIHEWKIYYGDEWDILKYNFEPLLGSEQKTEFGTSTKAEMTSEPETEPETTSKLESEPFPFPEDAFVRDDYIEHIEYVCVVFFTIDLIARIIFCPFKVNLLVSVLSWIDICSLAISYVVYIVEGVLPKEKYQASILDKLHCLQIVRVFRLLRLVKNFAGFRVLLYAFKASFREIMLMIAFLMIAVLLFSAFVFFSGDDAFPSIPDAFWWAIVTMTTVGYGDVVPKTALSKCIGAVCALSGVALIAVLIPIFVNNFLLFYAYSKVWGKKTYRNKNTNIKIDHTINDIDNMNDTYME